MAQQHHPRWSGRHHRLLPELERRPAAHDGDRAPGGEPAIERCAADHLVDGVVPPDVLSCGEQVAGSKRTITPLDVGVLLISATLSSGTRTFVSG